MTMNVLVRPKRTQSRLARRRSAPAARTHQDAEAGALATPRRRQELGPLQDQALYSCGCGFVFEAPVSTSVGCPHCGDAQAW
jgi:hypothetical protein